MKFNIIINKCKFKAEQLHLILISIDIRLINVILK